MRLFFIASFLLVLSSYAYAYIYTIDTETHRIFKSDGMPGQEAGEFPNKGNPHSIKPQEHSFNIPLSPEKTGRNTPLSNRMNFGVALNGVPFDPGTAEFYDNDPDSGWVLEAIGGGKDLGLDDNNAHVQPNGAYHYHGIPWRVIERPGHDKTVSLVGYAADGFAIYVSRTKLYKSGYQIKEGERPSGPGGKYDGRYTQDWEFVASGNLDECNGTYLNGRYIYALTEEFPFIPRCFKGEPDPSFMKPGPPEGHRGRHKHPHRHGRPKSLFR